MNLEYLLKRSEKKNSDFLYSPETTQVIFYVNSIILGKVTTFNMFWDIHT